jgi:hypothetical protein
MMLGSFPLPRSFVAALLITAASALHGSPTLLIGFNFDEAASGNQVTNDQGSLQVPGRFFSGAVRTGNTPGGFSTGALYTANRGTDYVLASQNNVTTGGVTYQGINGRLDNLTSFTTSIWINFAEGSSTAPANLDRIFRAGTTTGFGMRIITPQAGTISAGNFSLAMDIGSAGVTFGSTTTPVTVGANNQWLFIAMTFDRSLPENQAKLYIGTDVSNVYLAAQSTVLGTVANTGVLDNGLSVGRMSGLSAPTIRAVSAYMDDLRVYQGAGNLAFIEEIRTSNLAPIPEPTTYAMILGGAALGFALWRRRTAR